METENQATWMDQSPLSHCDLWQVNEHQPRSRDRLPTEEGLQWGSDPSFGYHGFSSPIGTWTEERLVQNLMRNMVNIYTNMNVGFDISRSIDEPTQKHVLDPMQLNGFTLPMFQPAMVPNERLSEAPSSPSSSPSSQIQDSMFPQAHTECTQRASCTRAASKSGQRKRKCVQKPGQRLCHCRSEKKRRELIGERYKQLCQLVPGLEKHSYTRKYVLEETAIWIKQLLQGNDGLHQQLAQLKEQEQLNRPRLFPVDEDEKFIC